VEFVAADLLDAPAVALAARGVDAIIHLGAIGRSAPWNVLEAVNVQGTRSVLDAARINGVRRVILASTMHVLGGYGRDERIGPTSALRPDSPYAESKVLMEELAQTFSDHHHLEIGCIRIGHVHPNRRQAEPGLWIAPADLATVIRAGLDHADLRFAILHGVAPYRGDDCGQRLMRGQYGIVWRYGGGPYSVALRRARVYFRQAPCGIEYRGGFFVAAAGPGGSPGSGGEVNHLVRADYTGGGVQTANLNR
jgi:uronate dehydrogenase